MSGIRLAIVGSREMTNTNLFTKAINEFVEKYGKPIEVVSGGAKGADTLGESWAKS